MKQGSTNRKVNQQAREVIASILLFEISDPRLSLVTITGCEVSYDRSVCNVFYTADRGEYEEVAEAFEKASGRIRSLMARQLSWRVAPALRFILDKSVDEAERIASALERDAERIPHPLSTRLATSALHPLSSATPSAIANRPPSPPSARPSKRPKKPIRNSGGSPL